MTEIINGALHETGNKLTAEQIERQCPERLRQIAKEIKARLSKADKQAEQSQNNLIAVDRLLAEAKELCDGGGFEKFRELFCPQLGKSQAYALLAIAGGKKTIAEHRAEERQRKQRTRANQKAAEANSGTVPENLQPMTEPEGNSGGIAPTDAAYLTPEEKPEPLKPTATARTGHTVKDVAFKEFNNVVVRLMQMTAHAKPHHFIGTAIRPGDLRKLGAFLSEIANLKSKSNVVPDAAPQPDEAVKASPDANNIVTDFGAHSGQVKMHNENRANRSNKSAMEEKTND